MEIFIQLFIFIPLSGFFLSLIVPGKKELVLSVGAFTTLGLQLMVLIVFLFFWLTHGHPVLNIPEIMIYKTAQYEFLVDFYFDRVSAVYLIVGSFLTFLITIYSRYYLHREEGYKRFFNAILFFYLGYILTILAGNFETLFIGWEVLGISSFLLIAFYRERYLPVKNAIKVFSIYRIGDVGILLLMWMSHHLWHENITFLKLSNATLVNEHLQAHSLIGVFISLMILIAATAKSAQFPFSSWLPRAMEGPTPSSAIFYGSLSVHMGVFMLLRTFPFWEHQISVRILFALVGFISAIIGTLTAHVQSSIKSQIAYASIAQIGIIFVEIAAGFQALALLHFAGNAFLRTYQLLVSPSMVSYLIREQFYHYTPRINSFENTWPQRVKYTIYMLSLKEWNLDWFMYAYIWMPMKKIGSGVSRMGNRAVLILYGVLLILGIVTLRTGFLKDYFIYPYFPFLFALLGLMLVLKAFVERRRIVYAWTYVFLNQMFIALAISFNERFEITHTILYISGALLSWLIGIVCLFFLLRRHQGLNLNGFNGLTSLYPRLAFVFLMACLGLSGFPITTTFIGEDLIYSHIQQNQLFLAALVSVSFIIDGLALIRMFARLFMGTNSKSNIEVPFRSS
ncbi:MAG: proton-conducting transporter membrane subunit [Bacteroidia bacterium]|jgi:NADH:ubiquinone oxidoreductase subunit 5 (subunit L)/multisubunit Na+/H+ antiporter MnhA subunit